MSLECIELPYRASLISQYAKLRHLPGFALLQSTDTTKGRYDIVSAKPYDAMVVHKNFPRPDLAFDTLQKRIRKIESTNQLPFQGGAIGYLSYDLGAELVGVRRALHPKMGNFPLLDMNFYDWGIITDHNLKKVTLLAAHRSPETKQIIEEVLSLWHSPIPSDESDFAVESNFEPLTLKDAYQAKFDSIKTALENGRVYQVNYTMPFLQRYRGDNWHLYQKIAQKNHVPYSAYYKGNAHDILSFSPERLLLHDKGCLLTSPIKGTARRDPNPQIDERLRTRLKQCPKNKAENIMIVDLMRNDLGRIAQTGSVKVEALCQVESYRRVHHLVSHIRAELHPKYSSLDGLKACFPGGSITGAPKLESMKMIHELEPYGRGIYCGSVGYFSNHDALIPILP